MGNYVKKQQKISFLLLANTRANGIWKISFIVFLAVGVTFLYIGFNFMIEITFEYIITYLKGDFKAFIQSFVCKKKLLYIFVESWIFSIKNESITNCNSYFHKQFFILKFGTFMIICRLSWNVSSFLEELTKLLNSLTSHSTTLI